MMRRFALRGWIVSVALTLGILLWLSLSAMGNHIFSDVPTAAFYHNAVEWIFNRSITSGCGSGLYCPDNPVLRSQMAVFMRNLGVALTPNTLIQTASGSALDFSLTPVICGGTSDLAPSFPQSAVVQAHVAALPSGLLTFGAISLFQVDGGAWDNTNPDFQMRATGNASEWVNVTQTGSIDLLPGHNYRFGAAVFSLPGSLVTTGDYRCQVIVTITNRNPSTSPF